MKKFNITVVRHTFAEVEVIAETEKEARDEALDIAEGGGVSFPNNKELYEVDSVEEEEYPYIDRDGKPYEPEVSFPAGGGLHKDCEFNADALYAYYIVKDRYSIGDYLLSKGFVEIIHGGDMEVWIKGNTKITYEGYGSGMWGYMCTDCIEY
jgi:hypothetical protein